MGEGKKKNTEREPERFPERYPSLLKGGGWAILNRFVTVE